MTTIDLPAALDDLAALLNTPSPTGFTDDAVARLETMLAAVPLPGLTMRRTAKGALAAFIPGRTSAPPRALTAHLDTLGLMVRQLKSDGTLRCTALGGLSWHSAEGDAVTVRTFDGTLLRGVLQQDNPSGHANPDLPSAPRNDRTLHIQLDARTSSARETAALGVAVGDYVFLDPRVEFSAGGTLRARFLDDKLGVVSILAALRAMAAAGHTPAAPTHLLFSVQEEVGHGGAHGFPPDLAELVVVDMAVVAPDQASDEDHVTLCAKDAAGPYHHGLTSHLRRLAAAHSIPFVVDVYPGYSSDGTAYWRAGGGAAVALVGPGVAASHGYERAHTSGLAATAQLLAAYLHHPVS